MTPEQSEALRDGHFIVHTLPKERMTRGEMVYLAKAVLAGKTVQISKATWARFANNQTQIINVLPLGLDHGVQRSADNDPALFILVCGDPLKPNLAFIYKDTEIKIVD